MPGTSSGLTSEYVVLWGHLDHIGVGAPVGGDSINNGAMDNASGVAALLEVARMLHDGSDRPRRSILFLACTGEEMGLLGSKPFAGRPTVAIGNIAANLNLDMFLPIIPLRIVRVTFSGWVSFLWRVEPARELPDLAMNRAAKRSGVRRCRREKLHRDMEDVSRSSDRLAARDLHLVVVLTAKQVDSKAGNRPDRQRASAFHETPGGASVQHLDPQLSRQGPELIVVALKLIHPVNHALPDSEFPY